MMNPNFSEFMEIVTTRNRRDGAVTAISEMNFGVEGAERIVHELDPDAAQAIVAYRVTEFVNSCDVSATVLAGVSGGGDSNALIAPLAAAIRDAGSELVAFTLVAEPLWPEASADRAADLCARHSVRHEILDGERITDMLNFRTGITDFYRSFVAEFGPSTEHFIATYLISTCARALARETGAVDFAMGYNREDVLAELLFCLMNGRPPLQYPTRRFGDHRLIMPVWEVPKNVLDACYPTFSLENYESRVTTTPQRGLIHYLAHSIEDIYPNLGLSLLTGICRLWEGQWPVMKPDGFADFFPDPHADQATINHAREFLAQHLH